MVEFLGLINIAVFTNISFSVFIAFVSEHALIRFYRCSQGSRSTEITSRLLVMDIFEAAAKNKVDKLKDAINAENVNSRNSEQKTPLIVATEAESEAAVAFLISAGADLDAQDKWDHTALMIAASLPSQPLCRALLEAGADKTKVDKKGKTALQSVPKKQTALAVLIDGWVGSAKSVRIRHLQASHSLFRCITRCQLLLLPQRVSKQKRQLLLQGLLRFVRVCIDF